MVPIDNLVHCKRKFINNHFFRKFYVTVTVLNTRDIVVNSSETHSHPDRIYNTPILK